MWTGGGGSKNLNFWGCHNGPLRFKVCLFFYTSVTSQNRIGCTGGGLSNLSETQAYLANL